MNKIILSLLTCVFVFRLSAQIPNPGFETWFSAGWFENPVNWKTGNNQIKVSVKKDTAAHSGQYAARIIDQIGATAGFPVTKHPSMLRIWYRSGVINKDSVYVNVNVFKSGILVDKGNFVTKKSMPTYALLGIVISQNSLVADSAEIQLKCSNPLSYLVADDLEFDFNTATNNQRATNQSITIFPNPVGSNSQINFNNSFGPGSYVIQDINGQFLASSTLLENGNIPLAHLNLSAGHYFLTINNASGLWHFTKFSVEK